jgi:hypothetical protein
LIYCVVPRELEHELFEKLTAYYADDDNVTVIVDRRGGGGSTEIATDPVARGSERRRRVAAGRMPLPRIDGSV